MAITQTEAETLHFQHRLWSNELSFVEDELKIFEHRLEKLVNTLQDRDMLAKLEHYQNQFIRQKEVLDQLQHDIKVHEQEIGRMLQNGSEPGDQDTARHLNMEGEMATFRKIYGELKSNFFKFMAANL